MKKRWLFNGMLVVLLFVAAVPIVRADDPVNRTERAEVRFLVGMIDHHHMALDMAHDCLMKAGTESLRQLCQDIITKQQNEINQMRGWLLIWYGIDYRSMSMMNMMGQGGMMGGMMQGTPPGQQHDQHHPGGMMQGTAVPGGMMQGTAVPGGMMHQGGYVIDMPMMGMMAGLHILTGIEYEIAWLEAMIEHHDDALHMSERILGVSERPEVVALAERIIEDQTAEIEMMEELITELSS